jgi:hypothetical protein
MKTGGMLAVRPVPAALPSPMQALPVLAMDPESMAHADRPADRADVIGIGGSLRHGDLRRELVNCDCWATAD